MEIIGLFPTPLGKFVLDRDLTKKELNFIKGLPTRPNEGNTTSDDNHVLKNKNLSSLSKFIDQSVNEFFQSVYQPSTEVSLYTTISWINYSEKNQWHHKHAHPNSFLSGVFYVESNEDDKILFFKEPAYRPISFDAKSYNPYNSESWWMETSEKTLYVFPSSFTHSVPAVTGDKTRISLSFNTFLKGQIGLDNSLTSLCLE